MAISFLSARRHRKKILFVFAAVIFLLFPLVYFCNAAVRHAAKGRLYNDLQQIPYNKVGLLLGTAKHLPNGYTNLYYVYRIQAAVALYKTGKVKYLLVSGDNGHTEYNEPETIRADLVAAGVDPAHIFLDYAGFRTFDSMIRLREIFGQRQVTVISQPFHNERAVFIASKEGIDAIGFNARDVKGGAGWKVQLREKLARVKVFADYLTGKKPSFLGKKIVLPD